MHLSSILHYRAGPKVMVYKLPIAMHGLVVTSISQPTITLWAWFASIIHSSSVKSCSPPPKYSWRKRLSQHWSFSDEATEPSNVRVGIWLGWGTDFLHSNSRTFFEHKLSRETSWLYKEQIYIQVNCMAELCNSTWLSHLEEFSNAIYKFKTDFYYKAYIVLM